VSDARLLRLERAALTGSKEDEFNYLLERERLGLLNNEGPVAWLEGKTANAFKLHAWQPCVFQYRITKFVTGRKPVAEMDGGWSLCRKIQRVHYSDWRRFELCIADMNREPERRIHRNRRNPIFCGHCADLVHSGIPALRHEGVRLQVLKVEFLPDPFEGTGYLMRTI